MADDKACEYLDTEGAAQLLGVSAETVKPLFKAWRESGGKVGLPHAVIGCKLIRTTREDVRRYYEAQKKNTAGGRTRERGDNRTEGTAGTEGKR